MRLQARGVGARFGGVIALEDVDVELEPGKILGVIGPNGSGKSTLFNCITGFVPLASGEIWSDGENLTGQSADRRIRTGIARTFQTPRIDADVTVLTSVLCGYLTSVDSGLAGSAVGRPRVWQDERRITADAQQLLADFDLTDIAHVPMGQLSMGQLRMVDVLRAMAMRPRYLLLDEPAAGLSVPEQELLMDGIRRIAAQGIGVLLVEHNFALVRQVADEVVVLQKGRKLVAGPPAEVALDPRVVDAYLGVGSTTLREDRAPVTVTADSVVLECENLQVAYGRAEVCAGLSFSVHAGEIMALLGPNGAGKSSLLSALAGIRLENRRWRGTISLAGEDITSMPAEQRPVSGLAFVPEGRGNVFVGMTVDENIQLGLRGSPSEERDRIETMILEVFPALPALMKAKAGLLSGGEQQMVSIAMALASDPKVLMLDEPTQGLAPAILDVLVAAFAELRSNGMGVLLAEQNQAFAAVQADRFVALRHGELVSTGTSEQLSNRDEIAAVYL